MRIRRVLTTAAVTAALALSGVAVATPAVAAPATAGAPAHARHDDSAVDLH